MVNFKSNIFIMKVRLILRVLNKKFNLQIKAMSLSNITLLGFKKQHLLIVFVKYLTI